MTIGHFRVSVCHKIAPAAAPCVEKSAAKFGGGRVVKVSRRIFPPIARWLTRCTSPRNRGICVVGKPIRAANSDIPRGIKPGATPRRRTWHKAGQQGRTTPTHHRRRRIWKNQHAGTPGCAPYRQRCRSSPYLVDDLFAAGGGGVDPPRGAYRTQGLQRAFGSPDRSFDVGGDVSRHRCAPFAGTRRTNWTRSGLLQSTTAKTLPIS